MSTSLQICYTLHVIHIFDEHGEEILIWISIKKFLFILILSLLDSIAR